MFFFVSNGDHRELHVLTHSFPTRRSSDLSFGYLPADGNAAEGGGCVYRATDARARLQDADRDAARTRRLLPRRGLSSGFLSPESDPSVHRALGQADRKSTRLNSSH